MFGQRNFCFARGQTVYAVWCEMKKQQNYENYEKISQEILARRKKL